MLTLLLAILTAVPVPARPVRYVTDNAHVLPADRADALNGKLAQFERDTSDQVLVYVDGDLPEGTTLEELSSEALHRWQVGQKGKDNGVILFLFTKPHLMRIEVGYGLEGALTDAKSKRITSTVMKPLLRNGDTASAVEQGAGAILATIRGEEFQGTGRTVAEGVAQHGVASNVGFLPFVVFFGIFGFIVLMATVGKRRGWVTSTSGGNGFSSNDSSSSDWSSGDSSSSSFSSSDSSSSNWSSSDSSSSDSFASGGGGGGGGGSSDSW